MIHPDLSHLAYNLATFLVTMLIVGVWIRRGRRAQTRQIDAAKSHHATTERRLRLLEENARTGRETTQETRERAKPRASTPSSRRTLDDARFSAMQDAVCALGARVQKVEAKVNASSPVDAEGDREGHLPEGRDTTVASEPSPADAEPDESATCVRAVADLRAAMAPMATHETPKPMPLGWIPRAPRVPPIRSTRPTLVGLPPTSNARPLHTLATVPRAAPSGTRRVVQNVEDPPSETLISAPDDQGSHDDVTGRKSLDRARVLLRYQALCNDVKRYGNHVGHCTLPTHGCLEDDGERATLADAGTQRGPRAPECTCPCEGCKRAQACFEQALREAARAARKEVDASSTSASR